VADASITSDLPGVLHFKGLIIGVRAASGSFEDCVWRVVGANYLRVLGASIVSGRDLDVRDETGPPVVVINETLRQRLGLSANPVGQGLWISEWYTIVGVVRDVHELGPRERVPPVVYMPLSDRSWTPTHLWLLVRPTRWGSLAGLREQLARLDPGLPVCRLATLQDVVASTMAETKFYAVTFAAFSAVALLLATAGLFALVSSGVETRIREIGVRMALGATPGRIAGAILRHAALLTCFGTFSGLGVFWAIARLLRAAIPDVAPADVPTVTAAMLLIAVTACAAVLPTLRRASSLQPIEVLRHE